MKLLLVVILMLICPISVIAHGQTSNTPDKAVYLTFDDGPSNNTSKILDILKEYKIKATFFVVKQDDYQEIYRRILNEGHTLGGHCSTHDYKLIYQSAESYYNDLMELNTFIKGVTGYEFNIIRFPGGSNNTVSIKYNHNIMNTITMQAATYGYTYYDWNVDSYDSVKKYSESREIADCVINQCINKDVCIVLMHDSYNNTLTPDALPIIIKNLYSMGYRFDRITADTPVVKFK